MGIISNIVLGILLLSVAILVIYSLNKPGSRYKLKKDYGLNDRQIDEKFGENVVTEDDLRSLEKQKRKNQHRKVA